MSTHDLLDRIARLDHTPSDEPVIPEPEVIGFFVSWVRKLRQWKQSTLADFARVSLSTVERVERGEKVSDEALERIAEALGYERGSFTAPRHRIGLEQAAAEVAEEFGQIEPVSVSPLRTQRQVRALATSHGREQEAAHPFRHRCGGRKCAPQGSVTL